MPPPPLSPSRDGGVPEGLSSRGSPSSLIDGMSAACWVSHSGAEVVGLGIDGMGGLLLAFGKRFPERRHRRLPACREPGCAMLQQIIKKFLRRARSGIRCVEHIGRCLTRFASSDLKK